MIHNSIVLPLPLSLSKAKTWEDFHTHYLWKLAYCCYTTVGTETTTRSYQRTVCMADDLPC